VSCTISRNGDLISTVFLEVTLKKAAGASFFPGEALLKEVELEIKTHQSRTVGCHARSEQRMYGKQWKRSATCV
jgi:hypothetical protein